METILIKCPHCNEKMQAPKDRESILCMFCGNSITLSNHEVVQKCDDNKCKENLDTILNTVDQVFENYHQQVKAFKRDSYFQLFEDFKAKNYTFFVAIKNCIANTSDANYTDICNQIADSLINHTKNDVNQIKRKSDKFSVQMDRNMFMVTFVLPSIKEIGTSKTDKLADFICEKWGETFKDSNIQASTYQAISEGFKRKLCYVTTAVCQSLHLGEDCEELHLIKEFRDNYLAHSDGGDILIDAYYDIAPTIVKRISREKEAELKYLWLYENYIKPCVEYIKLGKQEECKTVYCNMVDTLCEEYIYSKK